MLIGTPDFAGGTNFVVLAIITLAFSGHHHARQIVASIFIMLWGARLSGFLLFRIIKTGKDDRFDDKRDKFFSFLGFWVFQMIWVGQRILKNNATLRLTKNDRSGLFPCQ